MTREERKANYQLLCDQGKITDLLMQPWWMEATCDWDVCFGYRNEQVAAAMVFGLKKKFGFTVIGLPVFTHHIGIWFDKPAGISDHKWLTREKQLIWSMIDHLPKYDFFSMMFNGDSFDNWLPFYWKGFSQELRYTFELYPDTLSDEENEINSSFKKKLRKAGEVLQITRDVDHHVFFDMCMESFRRQKIKSLYTFDAFVKVITAVKAHDAGTLLGGLDANGKLVAVASVVWDRDRAYYFLSGESDAGRELSASLYLCRETQRIAFEERNVKVFDFCGSVLESVTEVRRQFGAKSVQLMHIYKARWKWLDMLYALRK